MRNRNRRRHKKRAGKKPNHMNRRTWRKVKKHLLASSEKSREDQRPRADPYRARRQLERMLPGLMYERRDIDGGPWGTF